MTTPPAPPGRDTGTGSAPPGSPPSVFGPDFLTELFRNPLDGGYADAAAKRAASGPPKPGARRAGFTARTVALVATGLLLTVAYQQTVAAQPEASKVRGGLVSDVQQRQSETDELQRQADALRTRAAKLRDAVVGSDAGVLDQLEARTGLGAVTGGGVVVTMADGPVPVDPVTGKPLEKDPGRVVDFDIQTVVNELWHEGAEAIAINGQRLTNSSTIRLAGSAILVDLAPLAQPYVIDAIGPSAMADTLPESQVGNFYHYLSVTYQMTFTVKPADGLTLPAAADPQLHKAQVIRPTTTPPGTPPGTPPSGGH